MGPPPFGDGNRKWRRHTPPCKTSFNGATAFRRWKLGGRQVVRWGHRHPSMGPPPFGDGNAGSVCRVLPARHTFNGATAFRRWKLEGPGETDPSRLRPSMGPPPFGDGNCPGQHYPQPGLRPSMGPPPFGDGNVTISCARFSRETTLQWGHRLSAMETSAPSFDLTGLTALQWGHRLSAMETGTSFTCQGWGMGRAFNGATAFRRWKRDKRHHQHHQRGRPSMGPPPFGDGNSLNRANLNAVRTPSMGPPPFGDGNRSLWLASVMDSCKSALFHKNRYRINDHASVAQLGFAAP